MIQYHQALAFRLSAFALFVLMLIAHSLSANAYYTVGETGKILGDDEHAFGTDLQFMTSEDTGANLTGNIEGGLNDEVGYRAIIGFGNIDFHLGASAKWIPIPDYEYQPAIGLVAGAVYARYRGRNEISFRFAPLVSKAFELNWGVIEPYTAIPFGPRYTSNDSDSDTDVISQYVLGTKYNPSHLDSPIGKVNFGLEFGFELKDSFNYLTFSATAPFDIFE